MLVSRLSLRDTMKESIFKKYILIILLSVMK